MPIDFIILTDKICNVTPMGELYFKSNIDEKYNIVIPESINGIIIKKISTNCFLNSKIENIVLPNTLKIIGNHAFYGCKNLMSIEIPDSVNTIGDFAFTNCSHLSNIIGMKNVNKIGKKTFDKTSWLKYKQDNNFLIDINDILIDGSTATGDIVIPQNIKHICGNAFSNNKNITSLIINGNVSKIADFAFDSCYNLKHVYMNDNVEKIGAGAFAKCTNLESINLSNNITTLNRSIFNGCLNLSNVNLPNKIKNITSHSFLNCKSLKYIIIPDTLESIERYAFDSCNNLEIAYKGANEELKRIFNHIMINDFKTYNIEIFSTQKIDNFIRNINSDNNYKNTFKNLKLSSGQETYLINQISEEINSVIDLNKKLYLLSLIDPIAQKSSIFKYDSFIEK